MSVLKRVEEAYLEVLRIVIIIAASLLLLGAVVFGVMAGKNFGGKSHAENSEASVTPDAVLAKLTEKNTEKPKGAEAKNAQSKLSVASSDPNQVYYDRTSVAVVNFINTYSKGLETVTKENIVEISRAKAELFKNDKVTTEFAAGLAVTMERTLADPKITQRVEKPAHRPSAAAAGQSTIEGNPYEQELPYKESPIGVVNDVLSTYMNLFVAKEAAKEKAEAKAVQEAVERQASAMMQLYVAGGSFAAFLFLVFISIVVKIERNLRAYKAATI